MTTYRDNEAVVHMLERCRELRRDATDAERLLWNVLRAGKLEGVKFRRQHQFGPYILDFYCHRIKMAIEIDGGQHLTKAGRASDAERQAYLAERGIGVLRFTNAAVLDETEAVVLKIWQQLHTLSLALSQGERKPE